MYILFLFAQFTWVSEMHIGKYEDWYSMGTPFLGLALSKYY